MLDNYIFVLLHSYNGKPSHLFPIRDLVKSNFNNPEVLIPVITKSVLSAPKIEDVVNRLLKTIDDCWEKKLKDTPKEDIKIVFIGHSMGALFARKLYVCACGENADVPLEAGIHAKNTRPWAGNVERIILMAGMNNGWKINIHLNFRRTLVMSVGSLLEPVLSIFGKPLIFGIRRGGPFITQLRLQSIKMQNEYSNGNKKVGNAPVIQMLGTVDDLVSPDDNIDLVSGNSFVYMEMPYSGHGNVIDVDDKKEVFYNGIKTTVGHVRSERLLEAIVEIPEKLKEHEITTAELNKINQDVSVTDVVFVIHGIRDEGYWTHKIAQRVVKVARENNSTKTDKNGNLVKRKFETETSSYGYFPLLHFALPNYRRAKVQWLMEQYSENMAKYPNAEFSYVGHSNGTYLLSKALDEYPACKFTHVLFAGSVVNHNYDWNKKITDGRVKKVYNIAASSDLVVGIFPHAFHYLGFKELGAAGYKGFQSGINKPVTNFTQIVTVPGGHGAAIEEDYWDNIAHFIVEGYPKTPIQPDQHKRCFPINGFGAVVIFLAILLVLILLGYGIWQLNCRGEWKVIIMMAYLFAVWKLVTKF